MNSTRANQLPKECGIDRVQRSILQIILSLPDNGDPCNSIYLTFLQLIKIWLKGVITMPHPVCRELTQEDHHYSAWSKGETSWCHIQLNGLLTQNQIHHAALDTIQFFFPTPSNINTTKKMHERLVASLMPMTLCNIRW